MEDRCVCCGNYVPEGRQVCLDCESKVKRLTVNEYQQAALRTASSMKPEDLIHNGALGLCGESGEVADIVKKWKFQGHDLDKQKMIKELGDVCWYIAITAEGLGVDIETVMQLNIEKLKNRYPEGFEAEKSINRTEEDD